MKTLLFLCTLTMIFASTSCREKPAVSITSNTFIYPTDVVRSAMYPDTDSLKKGAIVWIRVEKPSKKITGLSLHLPHPEDTVDARIHPVLGQSPQRDTVKRWYYERAKITRVY